MGNCPLLQTQFPVYIYYDGGNNTTMYINIFYVYSGSKGMDDYASLYTSNLGGIDYWPTNPELLKGTDTAFCTTDDGSCVGKGTGTATLNKGLSKYSNLNQTYGSSLKIFSDEMKWATGGGHTVDKLLIPSRGLEYLRMEFFTPVFALDSSGSLNWGYVEPFYFEYKRNNTGGHVMNLADFGSTGVPSQISDDQLRSMMPASINLNLLTDIQVYIKSTNESNEQKAKYPEIHFVEMTQDQKNLIPTSCQ